MEEIFVWIRGIYEAATGIARSSFWRFVIEWRYVCEMDREEMEAEIERLIPGLEYTLDQIYSWMSAAKGTTDIAERMLNEKFDMLSANLVSRVNPFPSTSTSPSSDGS